MVFWRAFEGLSRDYVNDQINEADLINGSLLALSIAQARFVCYLLLAQLLEQVSVPFAGLRHAVLEISDAFNAQLLVGIDLDEGLAPLLVFLPNSWLGCVEEFSIFSFYTSRLAVARKDDIAVRRRA